MSTPAAATSTLPERRWGPAPAREPVEAVVITSSRDGAEVPRVEGAARLIRDATYGGWSARQTYAHARLPDQFHLNGNLAKPAHDLHTVAVRLKHHRYPAPPEHAVAIWCREETAADPGKWRFRTAWFCGELVGARELARRVSAT
jgi:hypothetical protein